MSKGEIKITGWSICSASLDSPWGLLSGFHWFEGSDRSVCGQRYDGHPVLGQVPSLPGSVLSCSECCDWLKNRANSGAIDAIVLLINSPGGEAAAFPQQGDLA